MELTEETVELIKKVQVAIKDSPHTINKIELLENYNNEAVIQIDFRKEEQQ